MRTDNSTSSTHSLRISAAVLAGGKSSRMRTDKRFLRVDGEFLIDRALRLARDFIRPYGQEVFLCGDVPGKECLPDAIGGLGPLAGVQSAMDAMADTQKNWLLVLPVDMPLLNHEIFTSLILALNLERDSEDDAICFSGYELPCLLSVSEEVKAMLKSICRSEGPANARSFRSLFAAIKTRKIEIPPGLRSKMANANSPSDWRMIGEETHL